MNPDTVLLLFPTVNWYCGSCSAKIMANRDCLLKPVPTMKTKADGCFYIPNFSPDLLTIKFLFNDTNMVGDQIGVSYYPDGIVNIRDEVLVIDKYGTSEGRPEWDYMVDFVPDRKIDIKELTLVLKNFGKSGTYITDLSGVTVTFSTGQVESLYYGMVLIPVGATNVTVKRYGTPIGAMIIFCIM